MKPRPLPLPSIPLLGALIAACGGGGYTEPAWSTARDPLPPIPPSTAAPETAKKAAPLPPPDPPEEVPDHLGTPASSREAAPDWWKRHDHGYAPPITMSTARELYAEADPTGDPATSVALVCTLSVGDFRETAFTLGSMPADLTIPVAFGHGKKWQNITAWGPEDTNTIFFALPLATLETGDEVIFDVLDRDVFSNDTLDRIKATFKGTYPITFKGKRATADCRPVPRALIEKRYVKDRERADSAIASLEQAKPNVDDESLGLGSRGDGGASDAYEQLEHLAGIVGWDDPRIQKRAARIAPAAARLVEAMARAIDEKRASLPAPEGAPILLGDNNLALRTLEVMCDPDAVKKQRRWISDLGPDPVKNTHCMLRVELRNRRNAAMEIDTFFEHIGPLVKPQILSHNGHRYSFRMVALTRDGKTKAVPDHQWTIAPGEAVEVLVALIDSSKETAEPPFLLRAQHESAASAPNAKEWSTLAGGTIALRARSIACDDSVKNDVAQLRDTFGPRHEGPPCIVRVDLKNTAKTPIELDSFFHEIKPLQSLGLSGPGGKWIALALLGQAQKGSLVRLPDHLMLPPGATIDLALVADKGSFADAATPLDQLWFTARFSPVTTFVRLE